MCIGGICEIAGVVYEAAVPKTGQKTSYATGDDGDLEKGVAWPNPRFTDNGDGTVTDNLTDLIWLKNANCFGTRTWSQALSNCNGLNSGECGLSDGSSAGDWRLPNLKEMNSLISPQNDEPALPTGYPFTDVRAQYWSSTTTLYGTTRAFMQDVAHGGINYYDKNGYAFYVWPVRGGQ
jgi:hypothetical protein